MRTVRSRRRKNRKSILKKWVALGMSFLMVLNGAMPRISLGDALRSGADYAITEDDTVKAIRAALKKDKTFNGSFDLEGDYAWEYEDLLETYDTSLYKLNIKATDESASPSNIKKTKISAYLKLSNTEDGETSPSCEDRVIFVVKNYSKKEKKLKIDILGDEFDLRIPAKDAILQEDGELDVTEESASVSTGSDIMVNEAEQEMVASASDISEQVPSEDVSDDIEVGNDLDIEILDPVVLDGRAAVAFSIPAEDLVKMAKAEEYTCETESAKITALAAPDCFPESVTLEAREFDEDEEDTMSEILHNSNKLFAGKKSFDIHFLTEDRDEIEPDGPVEVSISLKKGTFPENADPDSFIIYHMTEEEAMNASTMAFYASEGADETDLCTNELVKEETVPFDELRTHTVVKEDTYETSFTTDSFSYFVLSYNGYNQVYAYLYDEEGNLLPGDELYGYVGSNKKFNPTDFCANWEGGWGSAASQNKWISAKTFTDLFGSRLEGYDYIDAYTDSEMTEHFNWIYFAKSSGYKGTWWVSTAEDKPDSAPSASDGTSRKITSSGNNAMKLYIKFKNNTVASELIDSVEDNGYFLAKAPENISKYATLNYKWYRSDDGETYEEVVRKKAANKTYNIEIDTAGSKLYPSRDIAMDVSVRRWYKAEVYVDGKLYKTYSPLQVQDYPCIMNGSFENPDVRLLGGTAGFDMPVGTKGLYWNTSATDKQLEVIRAGSVAGNNYGCSTAADGDQWVELNAEARGALFQHVLVQPGSTLYWRFSHRGRSGAENMYLVIAPKKTVDANSDTSELITIAQNVLNNEEGYTKDDGFDALSITDGKDAWGTYEGSYEVPENIWLLSFFFISNMGTTAGNFIDNVSFSTEVPGPIEGCANVTAKETVSGLLSDDVEKLSMHVWLEDADGNIAVDKNGSKAERNVTFGEVTDEQGSYTKTVSFPNMPDDKKYTIKKELYFDGSKVVPAAYTRTEESYSIYRNDVKEPSEDTDAISFMAYDEEMDRITVDFVDSFEMNSVPITVRKKLVGNAVDTNKAFSFTVTGTLKNGKAITDEISDEDKHFTLKGDEVKVIYVPFGSTVTISENDYSSEKYVTYYEIVPGEVVKGREATLPKVTLDRGVEFTNKRVEYSVTIKKIDENGNRLKDATLSLYDGKNLSDDTRIGTVTTDGTTDWTVNLTYGDYTLAESAAPDGYKIADAIVFNVSDTGVVTSNAENTVSTEDNISYTVTMVDAPLVGSVILENAINEEYSPFGTPSFVYEISKKDGSYKKVLMLTMDSLKKNTALDLPAGDYTVKQIPVSRYVPENETIDFTVTDGQTVKISFVNEITQYEMFSHVTGVTGTVGR